MERTGLKLRPRQYDSLKTATASRISALHLRDEVEYCRLLRDGGLVSETEWQYLARLLTNKESYFFRDSGQMALLRDSILPELINRNKSTKSLRIWSAGCSTGEEAYTLAMLVDELLRRAKNLDWKITVIGSDIDHNALEHARQGIYSQWSFRMVDPEIKRRYFDHLNNGWQVLEPLRSLIDFKPCNLVADPFPSSATGIFEMDLILCRNVFIYFESRAVAEVLEKFAKTLNFGGYLMTGHVETRGLIHPPLTTRSFPESDVYRKDGHASQAGLKSPQAHSAVRRTFSAPSKPKPLSTEEIDTLGLRLDPEPEQVVLLVARDFANLGQHEEAIKFCRKLIEEFPFSAAPYELLASIAQELGCDDEAKAHLKKALYLSPKSPYLYMELGALYHKEGDDLRAEKMRHSALELLRTSPPEAVVGSSGGPDAQECIRILTELHSEGA